MNADSDFYLCTRHKQDGDSRTGNSNFCKHKFTSEQTAWNNTVIISVLKLKENKGSLQNVEWVRSMFHERGHPSIPKGTTHKKAVPGHYGDAYRNTLGSCCRALCWLMAVTKSINSTMKMSLHTNKILLSQSPLLLSRCLDMNKGGCVLLFQMIYCLQK